MKLSTMHAALEVNRRDANDLKLAFELTPGGGGWHRAGPIRFRAATKV
jgi:hypothetical protein